MHINMLELRHYRSFIAVAEELHFGRAAQRLHMAQPPLSQQIQAMERLLGGALFNRTRRKVELTETGRLLLEEARKVLAQADKAEQLTLRAVRGEAGRLEIGFTGSLPFNTVMPTLIRRFRRAWPDIQLTLVEMPTARQAEALLDGRIDIGFLRPSVAVAIPGLDMRLVERERLTFVCNAEHPLAACPSLSVADLAKEEFIFLPRHIGTGLYDKVMGLAHAAGFVPTIAVEAHQMSTIVSMAAIGLGVSIVPDAMRRVQVDGVAFRPLVDAGAFIDLFVAARSANTAPVVANFMAMPPD